jgi:ketosteroid isomerase-like protein
MDVHEGESLPHGGPPCADDAAGGDRGRDRVRAREFWLDFFEPCESVQTETERIFPVGDEVVVLARQRGRMAGTNHDVEALVAAVYLVRDGRLARADFYSDRATALEAVGLQE